MLDYHDRCLDLILSSSRERDGILISRDEVPGESHCLHLKTKTSNVLDKKDNRPEMLDFVPRWGRYQTNTADV